MYCPITWLCFFLKSMSSRMGVYRHVHVCAYIRLKIFKPPYSIPQNNSPNKLNHSTTATHLDCFLVFSEYKQCSENIPVHAFFSLKSIYLETYFKKQNQWNQENLSKTLQIYFKSRLIFVNLPLKTFTIAPQSCMRLFTPTSLRQNTINLIIGSPLI